MYMCTICSLKKSELCSNPEFEFRRRKHPNEESHIEGMSDWCSQCKALRFFFKCDVDKDLSQHLDEEQPQKRLANDALEASIKCWIKADAQSKGNKDNTLRSISLDRSRRHKRDHSTIDKRSKSAVNASPPRNGKELERRSRQARNIFKLGYTIPIEGGGGNALDDEDDITPTASPRHRLDDPVNQTIEKSLRSNASPQSRSRKLQLHSRPVKNIFQLGVLKPGKHNKLDYPIPSEGEELRNAREDQAPFTEEDDFPSAVSPRQRLQMTNNRAIIENQTIEKRLRSIVNTSPQRRTKELDKRSHQAWDNFKLGALKPDKHVKLDILTPSEGKEQPNALENRTPDKDEDDATPSPRKLQIPYGRPTLEDRLDQQLIQQLQTENFKKKTTKLDKEKTLHKDTPKKQLPNVEILKNSQEFEDTPQKLLPNVEIIKKMQEMQEKELRKQLKTKLRDKKNQMTEWTHIRKHVENQYNRVKSELNELKYQADLQTERDRLAKQEGKDRMKGGANITAINSNQKELTELLKRKSIEAALNKKINAVLDKFQENKQKIELGIKEESKEICESTADQVVTESIKDENTSSCQPKYECKLNILVSTVQRSKFQGFADDPLKLQKSRKLSEVKNHRKLPLAQFQTVPCSREDLPKLLQLKPEALQPNKTHPLIVDISPIYCPDSDCKNLMLVTNFNEHLTRQHPSLAIERIAPCQAKTFFMDTRATLLNKSKCNMIYFLMDKFMDDKTKNLPELWPVLVMSTRLRLNKFFNPDDDQNSELQLVKSAESNNELFLIWLTCVLPKDVKIIGTISVLPTSSNPKIELLSVHTSEAYGIRSSQKLTNIFQSNRIMVLSGSYVSHLTDGGKNLLALQVLIH